MPGYELIGEEERKEVNDVFDRGGILFRHGFDNLRKTYKVNRFEEEFSKFNNAKYGLAVTSGTAALRVALSALDIGEGDEVITQCFTFVATVEAIVESGALPKCCEIDKTLNICPIDLEKRITEKTKAVIVVHMLGNPARLIEIQQICKKYNLFLIEDTAWGCGGKLNDKYLGTWGDIGTYSFDFAKTMTTGEGGMLIFKEKKYLQKAAAWHDHGHENNPNLPRWEDSRSSSGFNYRMMELQGAIGLAQLKKLNKVIEMQRAISSKIWESIKDIDGVERRELVPNAFETSDALIFFLKTKENASQCRNELLNNGLTTKILPEAFTWHFAGTWNHIKQLNFSHENKLDREFCFSRSLLNRAVSLPISYFFDLSNIKKIRSSIISALK